MYKKRHNHFTDQTQQWTIFHSQKKSLEIQIMHLEIKSKGGYVMHGGEEYMWGDQKTSKSLPPIKDSFE